MGVLAQGVVNHGIGADLFRVAPIQEGPHIAAIIAVVCGHAITRSAHMPAHSAYRDKDLRKVLRPRSSAHSVIMKKHDIIIFAAYAGKISDIAYWRAAYL